MKAITRNRFGGPDILRFTDIDIPHLRPDELLVRVRATSVNRGDALELRGWPYITRLIAHGITRPKRAVLGTDVAGTVVATGSTVDGFDVGDEIVGWGTGTFAEYAVVNARLAMRCPADIDALTAAAIPTAGVTARQALMAVGLPEPGQRVLVIGASGGVGSFVVQLAAASGAVVTAVVGNRNVELARALGAAEVIDHTTTDVTARHRHHDLIVDLAGVHPLGDLRRLLTSTGTLVVVGGQNPQSVTGMRRFAAAAIRSTFTRRRLLPLFATQDIEVLADVIALTASGVVRPTIGRTYQLPDTAAAIEQIETGHTTGKIVITA